ncbi:hypothetical protein [Nesterenkonia sp. NBAIMH1]|uniref:hypothetical protein n=1 Tax=Nesterenkonia sp. NBAIMH1 TaxID=2600320 RepID=UPI00352DE84F
MRAPRSEVVRSAGRAHELAQAWQCPLVIKPRSGNKGRGVFVNLTTPESITSAFESVHALGNDVLVEEFVQPFEEYRCIATAAECLSVVRRVLPHVVGDGQSTIAELIAEKNEERRRSPHLMKSLIPLDDVARSHLARQGSDPESVLPMGRAVTVRDVGGLSSGGDTVECSEEVPASLKDTASAAVASIGGVARGGRHRCLSCRRHSLRHRDQHRKRHCRASLSVAGRTQGTGKLSLAQPPQRSCPEDAPRRWGRCPATQDRGRFESTTITEPIDLVREAQALLESRGFTIAREGTRLWTAQARDGGVRWSFGPWTDYDLNIVRRLLKHPQVALNVIRSGGLPVTSEAAEGTILRVLPLVGRVCWQLQSMGPTSRATWLKVRLRSP